MLMLTVMERGTKAVLLSYCLTSGKNCTLTSTKSRTCLVSVNV